MAFPDLREMIMTIPGLLMGLTFHEFAHAWTAVRLGDDTPRLQGRVSLNPLVHLDWLGALMLLIAGYGWAKPVQVNVSRLRPHVWGDIAVSLAGVTMNFFLAILLFILSLMGRAGWLFGYINPALNETLYIAAEINVVLVAFNVLPIPPLDGFHVARYLFPRSWDGAVAWAYRLGPFILLLLVMQRILHRIMDPVADAVGAAVFHTVRFLLPVLF